MTNTLTWDFQPIRLPQVNADWLSVISLVVLLTMTFLAVTAIAEHCEDIKENLAKAIIAESIAIAAAVAAREVFKAAMVSGNPWAIAAATAVLTVALAAVTAAGIAIGYFARQLAECEQEHQPASGGCDSG